MAGQSLAGAATATMLTLVAEGCSLMFNLKFLLPFDL